MDAPVKKLRTRPQPEIGRGPAIVRPSREEAEEAVRTLIAYAGDDPDREGLRETPRRIGEFPHTARNPQLCFGDVTN